eukprot:1146463-Pelagomonas_calceolata.AAC.2
MDTSSHLPFRQSISGGNGSMAPKIWLVCVLSAEMHGRPLQLLFESHRYVCIFPCAAAAAAEQKY